MHRGINIYDYIAPSEFSSRFVTQWGIKTFRVNPLAQLGAVGDGIRIDPGEQAALAKFCTNKGTYLTYLQTQCLGLVDTLLGLLPAGRKIIISLAQWPGLTQIHEGTHFHVLLMKPFAWKMGSAYVSHQYPYNIINKQGWSTATVATVETEANSPLQTYKDAISYLVARYGNNSKVLGYDIAGEPQEPDIKKIPNCQYHTTWKDLSIQIVKLVKQGLGTNPHNQQIFVGAKYSDPNELLDLVTVKKNGVRYYSYPYPKQAPVTLKFHFYEPFSFTHQGIEWRSGVNQDRQYNSRKIWPWPWREKVKWNEDFIRSKIDNAVQAAKALTLDGLAVSEGNKRNAVMLPLWIGEFAAVRWAPKTTGTPERTPSWTPRGEGLTADSRLNWLKHVIRVCSKPGLQISWSYLDSISSSLPVASPATIDAPWSLIHDGEFDPRPACIQTNPIYKQVLPQSFAPPLVCPLSTPTVTWYKATSGSPKEAPLTMSTDTITYLKSEWAKPTVYP